MTGTHSKNNNNKDDYYDNEKPKHRTLPQQQKVFLSVTPSVNDWSKDESPQLRELRRRRQRQQQRKPKTRNSTAAAKCISFVQSLR